MPPHSGHLMLMATESSSATACYLPVYDNNPSTQVFASGISINSSYVYFFRNNPSTKCAV